MFTPALKTLRAPIDLPPSFDLSHEMTLRAPEKHLANFNVEPIHSHA